MPIQKANSVWINLNYGLDTNMSLVERAMNDTRTFDRMMRLYRNSSLRYLNWLMDQMKTQLSPTDREMDADKIWDDVCAMMPDQLITKWSKGDLAFRDVLCEAVHHCWHKRQNVRPYVPGIDGLASPIPGADEERLRLDREFVLARARERLKHSEKDKNGLLYRAFIVWELDKYASKKSLNDKMAILIGRQVINQLYYRKLLSKARFQFGKYLSEEVENLFAEKEDLSVEKYREAFERLDLMDDYVMNSGYCRNLLELPEAEDEK